LILIAPYLRFNGNCEEAFDLYRRAFEGELLSLQRYGDVPGFAEIGADQILHAQLRLTGDSYIMGSDTGEDIVPGSSVYISLELTDEALAQRAWALLADGGSVLMELDSTFFAKLHGSVADKYGFVWMFTVNN
jgi:PhnB protein